MKRFALVSLFALLFSCTAEQTATAKAPGKLKFKDEAGTVVFSIKPKSDGAKVVDGRDQEIARLKDKGSKLKVKGPDDRVIAVIKGDANKLKIKSESGDELYKLQRSDDGRYKLKNAAGETLYVVKPKDYGFKIQDGKDNDIAKVKKKSNKVKLKDNAGRTLYETKDDVSVIGVACLAFSRLDLPLRVALFYKMDSAR